jgi:hypothetical protein
MSRKAGGSFKAPILKEEIGYTIARPQWSREGVHGGIGGF